MLPIFDQQRTRIHLQLLNGNAKSNRYQVYYICFQQLSRWRSLQLLYYYWTHRARASFFLDQPTISRKACHHQVYFQVFSFFWEHPNSWLFTIFHHAYTIFFHQLMRKQANSEKPNRIFSKVLIHLFQKFSCRNLWSRIFDWPFGIHDFHVTYWHNQEI